MPQLAALKPTTSEGQHSSSYQNFRTEPVNGALGAEISEIDLSKIKNDDVYKEIRQALIRHQVIIFRNQNLTSEDLVNLGKQFGDLQINPFVKGLDGFPEIMPIRSEENHEKQFTGLWHSDISWDFRPSMGSLLYAVDVPNNGGDTLFANMYLAYSSLSTGMQSLLLGLGAEHRVDRFHRSKAEHADIPEDGVIHPVIRTHPESGKKILYVNEYFTTRFEDMTEEESEPLLKFLYEHAVRPDFCCRIQWKPGTLVFWDNRCTQHYATNDYAGQKRLMYRVTIDGEIPE